jgi:hypothetical protein
MQTIETEENEPSSEKIAESEEWLRNI